MQIHFFIDQQYRRDQFLEGYELPSKCQMECDISKLTREEREVILHSYYPNVETIVPEIRLHLPIYDASKNEISRKPWIAQINPQVTSPEEIVRHWARLYSAELADAEQKYNNH